MQNQSKKESARAGGNRGPRVGEGVQKPRSNGHIITITVQTQALQLCLRLDIMCAYCPTLVYDFIDCILSAVVQPTGRVSPTYSV